MPRGFSAVRVASLLFAVCLLCARSPEARAADGWERLQANDHAGARQAFQAALKSNPNDGSALRGLAFVLQKEDDQMALVQCLARVVRVSAKSWQAEAYWALLCHCVDETGQYAALEDASRAILAGTGGSPTLRAQADLVMAQLAERTGRRAEADAKWAKMGYVRQWRVIGPFDNPSKSGFDRAFDVESDLSLRKTHKGRDDMPLRWYPQLAMGRNGLCDLDLSLGDSHSGVFYAVTAVYSDAPANVRLSLDALAPTKVYVGGKLILMHKYDLTDADDVCTDTFVAPVSLAKGWNTVLVKIAKDGMKNPCFRLRFLDAEGRAVYGLKADPANIVSAPCAPGAVANAEGAPVMLLKKQPPSFERDVLLAANQLDLGDLEGATSTLRAALKRTPENGYLRWQLHQVLEADGQNDEANAERTLAMKLDKIVAGAESDAMLEQADKMAKPEYVAQLKALVARFPKSPKIRSALAEAERRADLKADAIRSARLAVKLAPGSSKYSELCETLNESGRSADVERTVAEALKLYPDDTELLDYWAGTLTYKGKTAEAMKVYEQLLAGVVAKPEYRVALASLYREKRDLVHAAQVLSYARKQRPQDTSICAELGDILREMGKKSEAMDLYRTAIALDPSRVQVRDKIQILSGEKPVMDLAPATNGQPIVAQALKDKAPASTSVIVYLDEARQVVYPDAAMIARFHEIVKFCDASAAEQYQTYPLSRPSSTARVVVEVAKLMKADGKVQDVADSSGSGEINLPSLGAGDVLDLVYRIEDHNRGALASRFWTEWHFSHHAGPVKTSRYVLITPKGLAYRTAEHRAVPKPTVSEQKDWRIAEWRAADVPAIATQEMSPPVLDQVAWLDISNVEDWSEIVRWYAALSGPRCVPDERVRAKAVDLTRDAKTQSEKVHAIVAFVRAIRYQTTPFRLSAYVPEEGKVVLRDQYGDCKDKAALIVAMLSCVGVKADMILISDRETHGITPYLPSPRFTHAIALAHLDSGPMWIDGTADELAFGNLPCVLYGVPALVVSPETKGLTPAPADPKEKSTVLVDMVGAIGESGALTAEVKLEATGTWAWALRSAIKALPKDKMDEFYRGFSSGLVKGSTLVNGGMEGQENADVPLVIRVKVTANDFATPAGSFLLVRLPGSSMGNRAIEALAPAQFPSGLEVASQRGVANIVVRLGLPPGYTAPDLVPTAHVDTKWGSYDMVRSVDGGTLNARQTATHTALRVEPADVAAYLDFLKLGIKEGDKPIVLKKP